MSPASRRTETTYSTKSQRHSDLSKHRSSRKAGISMQEPHNSSTSHQDDRAVITDVKQDMQHDIPPTTATEHQGTETSKPAFDQQGRSDQEQHEKVKFRDRTQTLEDKLARDKPAFDQQGRSDQEQHEKGRFRDRTHALPVETKPAREIDHSKQLKEILAEREEMLKEKEAELTSTKDMMHSRENKIRELSDANHRQSDELRQTNAELHHVKTKYQQTSQLLQERSEELFTAQQFLGKADSISPTEVARLVEILNTEITQLSSFILDSLDSLTYRKVSANDLGHLLEELRAFLSPRLCDHLWHRFNRPDKEFDGSDMLTQLVLQSGLTNACPFIINDWNPPFWDQRVAFDRIYGEMGRKVGQVVAGKWRALSSTYLRVDREKNKEWLRVVLQQLITVVVGPAQSGDYRALSTDLRNKVDDITRRALEIRKHVRGSVTSMDLEVYSVPCGTQFDASQMEDANDGPNGGKGKTENDNRRPQRKVICTLDMGLLYKKKVPYGKQGEFRDEIGVTLKPKVVLDDAFAPESSSR